MLTHARSRRLNPTHGTDTDLDAVARAADDSHHQRQTPTIVERLLHHPNDVFVGVITVRARPELLAQVDRGSTCTVILAGSGT